MSSYTELLFLKTLINDNLYLTNRIVSILDKHEDKGYAILSLKAQNERLDKILDILEGRDGN